LDKYRPSDAFLIRCRYELLPNFDPDSEKEGNFPPIDAGKQFALEKHGIQVLP